MDQTTRFVAFDRAHQQALQSIRDLMHDDDDDVRLLINWLMTTNANPYGFLPEAWAGAMDDAVGFAALCHHIHHALVDDGEINFIVVTKLIDITVGRHVGKPTCITVPGEPRITFTDRWSQDADKMLSPLELSEKREVRADRTVRYDIAFLAGVKEFIAAHDQYAIVTLRKCFLADARRNLQDAITHYQTDPLFQSAWITEATKAATGDRN